MPAGEFKILAINPGSTSTKFGVYSGEREEFARNLRHTETELAPFRGRPVLEQREFRSALIEREIEAAGYNLQTLDAVAGRGGLLRPLASGTYLVNEAMLEELRRAPYGEHASNLGAVLADSIARDAGVQAYIVDPVSVDEWPERARLSGSPLAPRRCLSHALNTKAVAKRYGREQGRSYEQLRLIVAHAGSGISVSAHADARMIDVNNSQEEGPFSADRAGGVPAVRLVDLCFSGQYTQKQVKTALFGEGGFYAYLGTKDLTEVERRIAARDADAALVFDAMVYQIAKEIGAMAAALAGRVDAVLITGGMGYSEKFVSQLRTAVEWIAPVQVYPGEDELRALAAGVLRVLRREEPTRAFATMAAAQG